MEVFNRFLGNVMDILIYAIVFAILLGIAMPTLSTREYIGFGCILGFFAGSINNVERVLRELFDEQK